MHCLLLPVLSSFLDYFYTIYKLGLHSSWLWRWSSEFCPFLGSNGKSVSLSKVKVVRHLSGQSKESQYMCKFWISEMIYNFSVHLISPPTPQKVSHCKHSSWLPFSLLWVWAWPELKQRPLESIRRHLQSQLLHHPPGKHLRGHFISGSFCVFICISRGWTLSSPKTFITDPINT